MLLSAKNIFTDWALPVGTCRGEESTSRSSTNPVFFPYTFYQLDLLTIWYSVTQLVMLMPFISKNLSALTLISACAFFHAWRYGGGGIDWCSVSVSHWKKSFSKWWFLWASYVFLWVVPWCQSKGSSDCQYIFLSEVFGTIFVQICVVFNSYCTICLYQIGDHPKAQTSVFPHNYITFLNVSLIFCSQSSTATFIIFDLF